MKIGKVTCLMSRHKSDKLSFDKLVISDWKTLVF